MSLRTILVPVGGVETDAVVLATAFGVADQFAAHVDVLFARHSPAEAVPLVGEGMASSVVHQLMETAEVEWLRRRDAARAAFDRAVADAGLSRAAAPVAGGGATVRWREDVGQEDALVAAACPLNDLAVMTLAPANNDDVQHGATLEAALVHGGRPLLLVTQVQPRSVGTRVAIAWRGDAQGARAVAGARPFIETAEEVHVLTADTRRTTGARSHDLVDYFAWHGTSAVAHAIEPGDLPVGAALLANAADLGCDLLVLGGYSHSRLRQFVFGGVTRFVLRHAGMPILMAH